MMEPVLLPEPKPELTSADIPAAKPWAISGSEKGERSVVKSLRLQPEVLEAHVEHLFEKYAVMEKELERVECENLEGAEVVFVAVTPRAIIIMGAPASMVNSASSTA